MRSCWSDSYAINYHQILLYCRVIYEDLDKEIKKVKDKVDGFEASFRAENLGEDIQAKFATVSEVR